MIRVKYLILYLKSLILYSWRFKKYGALTILRGFHNLEHARNIEIGRKVRILPGARMEAIKKWSGKEYSPSVKIGNNVNIGHNFFLTCATSITIGDRVLISDTVAVIDNNHLHEDLGVSPSDSGIETSPVVIGSDVTIYRCSTILAGVSIGRNAIIGAYSLVKEDVPEGAIVGGVPAKVIRIRKQQK